jgi:hypothetical protein
MLQHDGTDREVQVRISAEDLEHSFGKSIVEPLTRLLVTIDSDALRHQSSREALSHMSALLYW